MLVRSLRNRASMASIKSNYASSLSVINIHRQFTSNSSPDDMADGKVQNIQEIRQEPSSVMRKAKHKIPQKRASKLLDELHAEHLGKMQRDFPPFRAGDAIEITYFPFKTAPQPVSAKGTVISKVNRGLGSNVTILNTVLGYPVEHQINLYDPLIQDLKVLAHQRIHDGKKRVRRSKLYYLRDRNPSQYSV